MRPFLSIITLQLLLCLPAAAQPSGRVAEIVAKLSEKNAVESDRVGFPGSPTEQYPHFEQLKNIASTKELRKLTRHQSPAVRGYAFWGLIERKANWLLPILAEHIEDTTRVGYAFGCIVSSKMVVDLYIELLLEWHYTSRGYDFWDYGGLPKRERRFLDSLTLYSKYELEHLPKVLKHHDPKPEDHRRIRYWAGRRIDALPVLAKYRREADRPYILSFKDSLVQRRFSKEGRTPYEHIFEAVGQYPDDYFLPLLEEFAEQRLFDREYRYACYSFYKACVAYDPSKTLELLSRALYSQDTSKHVKELGELALNAMGDQPKPAYIPLMVKAWESRRMLSQSGFYYLAEEAEDDAFKIAQEWLSIEANLQDDNNQWIAEAILEVMAKKDRLKAINIIASHIPHVASHSLSRLVKVAQGLMANEFINPLLQVVSQTKSRKAFFLAADLLLLYRKKGIRKRLFESAKQNVHIVGEAQSWEAIKQHLTHRSRKKRLKEEANSFYGF